MAQYSYKGYRQNGRPVEGAIECDTKDLAVRLLRERGITATKISEVRNSWWRKDINLGIFQGVSNQTLITFTRNLALLLRAGSPINEALLSMEAEHDARFRAILRSMGRDLEEGLKLSDAMDRYPDVFPDTYRQMVRSGEISGKLDFVLTRLVDNLKRTQRLRRKIIKALSYPSVIISVATLLVIVVITVLVPRFAAIYAELGGELPLPTQIVMNVSSVLSPPDGGLIPVKMLLWLIMLLGVSVLGYIASWREILPKVTSLLLTVLGLGLGTYIISQLPVPGSIGHTSQLTATFFRLGFFVFMLVMIWQSIKYIINTPGGREVWDRTKFRLPFIGNLVQQVTLARFASTLSALYDSGIDLNEAIVTAGRSCGNVTVERASIRVRNRIVNGGGLAESFRVEPVFPAMMVQMIATGEIGGNIPEQLTFVSEEFEENVDAVIERLDAFIEPLLLLIVGVIIGTIIISMYLPMFKIYDLLGEKTF